MRPLLRRPFRGLAALAGLALFASVVPGSGVAGAQGAPGSAATQGGDGTVGIRLVDAPTERADDPRAHQYIVDHLAPGASISRRIEVHNKTDGEVTVALYAAAASVGGGQFLFGEDRSPNELTGWTTLNPSSLTLSAGERGVATVTIAVGADASGGERYGVVWAEVRGAAPEGGVTVVNRVGVRMYVSVGGAAEPPTDFEIESLTAERDADGRPVVRADVRNTGGRALDLAGRLELFDGPGGLQAGPFALEVGTTVGPGEAAPASVLLDPELPDGPWRAVVTVKSGLVEKAAEATITFPAEAARAAAPVQARSLESEGTNLLRLLLAVGVVLLAGGGLISVISARRRRRGPRPGPGPADPPRRPLAAPGSRPGRRGGESPPAARGRRPPAPRGRATGSNRARRQARPSVPAR